VARAAPQTSGLRAADLRSYVCTFVMPDGAVVTEVVRAKTEKGARQAGLYASMRAAAAHGGKARSARIRLLETPPGHATILPGTRGAG